VANPYPARTYTLQDAPSFAWRSNELAGKSDKEDFVAVFKVHCREEAKHNQIIETINDYFMAEQGD